jgi:uncharacterized protein (UPF0297 family)
MDEIIEILMRRDGNTEQEARSRIREVLNLMEECGYDPVVSEQIFMEMLGLEPDYIINLLL